MVERINDKDLESVNGGITLEGFEESDYEVVYKKDSGSEWNPDKPIDAGTYKAKIVLDDEGNYKKQFDV